MNTDRVPPSVTTPLKLTIKIGGQTLGEKSVNKSSIRALNSVPNTSVSDVSNELDLSFDDEEEEDDDEDVSLDEDMDESADDDEQWLDALEEGRLHEVDDELKKIRDPKLMTARQRALLENKCLKEKSETSKAMIASQELSDKLSDEMIEKKLLRDGRRRQRAEEKREKDKKDTIDRLLKKKQEMAQKARKKKRVETPRITYKNCQNGIYICLPNGMSFNQLLTPRVGHQSRPTGDDIPVKCARDGCENRKKYLCAKTQQPVCSLICYKTINKIN